MHRLWPAVILALVISAESASAATYYISAGAGIDTNTATQAQSKTTPWAHLPCMANASGGAKAYTPAPGDRFVLKGGESWPRPSFPCVWRGSGNSSDPIYIGVDPTWFAGAAWARPVLDAGGAHISSASNVMLDFRNADYLTVDNFEFTGFKASNWTAYGECAMIEAVGALNLTIDHIYVRNFAIDQASDTNCMAVQGATFAPYGGNSVVQNSVFVGSGASFGEAIRCLGTIKNSVIHDMIGMIFPCGHGEVSGNLLYNCGYPSFPPGATNTHGDAIQVNGADGAFYIHDNVIHDTGRDGNGNECEAGLIGNPGETDYVWNNISYNIHGNSWALTQNASPGIAAYFWNNTMVGGMDGSGYCIRQGHGGTYSTIQIRNSHCVTSAGRVDDPALSATAKLVTNNLVQTMAAANSQGFSAAQTFAFSPITAAQSTVAAGANLSSQCTGAVAALCHDSSYGSTQTATNTTATPARSWSARPTGTTAWDIGAYQYVTSVPAPAAPTNLRIIVQ